MLMSDTSVFTLQAVPPKDRNYEIVLLIHPDKAPQFEAITKKCLSMVEDSGGIVHRFEDWGVKKLAYKIEGCSVARYVLMNIECSLSILAELEHNFKFSGNFIRYLILKKKFAIKTPSPMKLGIPSPVVQETAVADSSVDPVDVVSVNTDTGVVEDGDGDNAIVTE